MQASRVARGMGDGRPKSVRRVLVVAHFFPPIAGPDSQRTAKFVKHLPAYGWQPFVVCASDAHLFGIGDDATMLENIPPEAHIFRLPAVSPLVPRRAVQRILGIQPQRNADRGRELGAPIEEQEDGGYLRQAFAVLSWPFRAFEFPPIDFGLYWALRVAPLCRRLIKQHDIDLVFTTSFPYSDHVTGLLLRALTGKPWVADFQDPWSQNLVARQTGWRRWCDVQMERMVLARADRVVSVTPGYTAGLRSLAPQRPEAGFATIENGVDPVDVVLAAPAEAASFVYGGEGVRTIVHVGTVYPGASIPLLEAAQRISDGAPKPRIVFVGGLGEPDRSWLETHPLGPRVVLTPRVPYRDALSITRSADVLLLLMPDEPGWAVHHSSKLFEYMQSGVPILFVGPSGAASDLIAESGVGCSVTSRDQAGIAEALCLIAHDPAAFEARWYHPRPEVIARYHHRVLTGRLAQVFDAVVNERSTDCLQR